MYIQKAEITNIKSIEHFEIDFKNPAGWHVLIGDNGAGKSTIVRSMALALVGADEITGLRFNLRDWVRWKENDLVFPSKINLNILADEKLDLLDTKIDYFVESLCGVNTYPILLEFKSDDSQKITLTMGSEEAVVTKAKPLETKTTKVSYRHSFAKDGFFSVAFGPYRRFEGGSSEWDEVYSSPTLATLAAHLSIFNESVALTEPIKWLKDLNYKSLEKNPESEHTLENLKKLINSEDFLPHNSKLEKISSDGVFFKDGNGSTISVNQMSDGYRSILSLTFELIRQLVRVYGSEKVFKKIETGEMFIDLPGVVLIDEIDAHLHPTWQTRIGQWFLKYFPNLQFIVTTHSPLVCRACGEKGSIWQLKAPGSVEESHEITGVDRDRLIYGDILDAYGTELFGSKVSIAKESIEKQEDLIKLSKKEMLGIISVDEQTKLDKLREIFPTHAEVEL